MSEFNLIPAVNSSNSFPDAVNTAIAKSTPVQNEIKSKSSFPTGGKTGQALVKTDTGYAWGDVATTAWNSSAQAKAQGFWAIMSDTAPTETTMYGVPVLWIDTSIVRDKNAYPPKAPTFSIANSNYIIPSDEGVTYQVNGETKSAGTYQVTPPVKIDIVSVAKTGYTLAGTTSWSKTYDKNVSAYEVAALSMNPEHYYPLNEAAAPYSDKGLVPVPLSTLDQSKVIASPGIGGIASGSIKVTGGVGVRAGNLLPSGTSKYTVAMAIKANSITTPSGQLAALWGNNYIKVDLANDYGTTPTYVHSIKDGSGVAKAVKKVFTQDLSIHHLAFTYDGTNIATYVDGVLAGTAAASGSVSTGNWLQLAYINDYFVSGIIVDSTRAFTVSEIKSLSDALVR